MKLIILTAIALTSVYATPSVHAQATTQNASLAKSLQDVYLYWRNAMIKRNYNAWKKVTARHRRAALQNRVLSEKGAWPADVFRLPAAPPSIAGLKMLRSRSKGATAKLVYFGKIDFGVGGNPKDNLLVLSFIYESKSWKYDTAEFVSLGGLKGVRKQILAGNLDYVDGQAFLPTGKLPTQPIIVRRAKYIAKVYSYCPGREVNISVNKISRHRLQNTQAAEVIIGGARDGMNEIWFSIKDLPGNKGNKAMTIRVYLFSQNKGVKPIKVFEYQTKDGEKPKGNTSTIFNVSSAVGKKILGR